MAGLTDAARARTRGTTSTADRVVRGARRGEVAVAALAERGERVVRARRGERGHDDEIGAARPPERRDGRRAGRPDAGELAAPAEPVALRRDALGVGNPPALEVH